MEKHKDEACDYYEIHEDSMEIINKTMPEETELEDLADLFKIFGDSTRIRILFVLFETEVCVCDLAKQTGEEPTRGKVHFLFSGR
mgnify:CR=1 FL=1